jgi:hypothetical protein
VRLLREEIHRKGRMDKAIPRSWSNRNVWKSHWVALVVQCSIRIGSRLSQSAISVHDYEPSQKQFQRYEFSVEVNAIQ